QGQPLHLKEASHEKKQTQPPPRYTEAKLVQVMERRGIGRPSTFAPTVKTLKERGYAEVGKRQLQATVLGLEVDAFLQKTLPELLEAEFTAQMEDKLDAIAAGQEDWERYIIGWNEDYFAPALAKAFQVVERKPHAEPKSQTTNSMSHPSKESKMACPQCGHKMVEVTSKSKKLHKNYFLKCPGCEALMFYNKWHQAWELPTEKREEASQALKLTDHVCPVCGEKLAEREYEKEGQKKRMLVCSSPQARTDKKHKDVVYFESRNVFWSKKYGELLRESPSLP
ncbi:MAG: DNA topoisomerase, partial [Microcystaceae cyanobacterium]